MMEKAAIYVRYDNRDSRETSISTQLKYCREYAESHGMEIVNVYTDRGVSGLTVNRPAFKRLIADGMKEEFDTVLFYQNGYFSGNFCDYVHYRDMLAHKGVILLSVNDNSTSLFMNHLISKIVNQ